MTLPKTNKMSDNPMMLATIATESSSATDSLSDDDADRDPDYRPVERVKEKSPYSFYVKTNSESCAMKRGKLTALMQRLSDLVGSRRAGKSTSSTAFILYDAMMYIGFYVDIFRSPGGKSGYELHLARQRAYRAYERYMFKKARQVLHIYDSTMTKRKTVRLLIRYIEAYRSI